MLVKAQICVDCVAGSEKSSSTTGRTTMGHVLAQSVAVEGLENEKKGFGIGHGGPKNRAGWSPSSTAEDEIRAGRSLFS